MYKITYIYQDLVNLELALLQYTLNYYTNNGYNSYMLPDLAYQSVIV